MGSFFKRRVKLINSRIPSKQNEFIRNFLFLFSRSILIPQLDSQTHLRIGFKKTIGAATEEENDNTNPKKNIRKKILILFCA
ncbi:hypothetical protein CH380_08305 [Leptospira adleri]|uniref:Uncharacterized protein n=1 Tax=Leptospira adleri TaxID=2023186 RepID=A0A2M9YQ21_9LEPT|nr:hypothetical protein CH380_08305 [Leptospira adleri]PJZ61398.1 hypothetical protein CH376_13450 [Leptospira adleri]